jgi:hypothetical protein
MKTPLSRFFSFSNWCTQEENKTMLMLLKNDVLNTEAYVPLNKTNGKNGFWLITKFHGELKKKNSTFN